MRLSCGIEVKTFIELPSLYKNSASSCIIIEIALISGGYGSVTNKIFKLSYRKMFQFSSCLVVKEHSACNFVGRKDAECVCFFEIIFAHEDEQRPNYDKLSMNISELYY